MTSTSGLEQTAHLLSSFIALARIFYHFCFFRNFFWSWDQVYLAYSAYVMWEITGLSQPKHCVGRDAIVWASSRFAAIFNTNEFHLLPQVLIIKLTNVDFGESVPFALMADDVTDVAPRDVTPPVTVWVRLVLSAPEAVAAMLVE
jgi:hypothetical protein